MSELLDGLREKLAGRLKETTIFVTAYELDQMIRAVEQQAESRPNAQDDAEALAVGDPDAAPSLAILASLERELKQTKADVCALEHIVEKIKAERHEAQAALRDAREQITLAQTPLELAGMYHSGKSLSDNVRELLEKYQDLKRATMYPDPAPTLTAPTPAPEYPEAPLSEFPASLMPYTRSRKWTARHSVPERFTMIRLLANGAAPLAIAQEMDLDVKDVYHVRSHFQHLISFAATATPERFNRLERAWCDWYNVDPPRPVKPIEYVSAEGELAAQDREIALALKGLEFEGFSDELAKAIVAYLMRHPDATAGDVLNGVKLPDDPCPLFGKGVALYEHLPRLREVAKEQSA